MKPTTWGLLFTLVVLIAGCQREGSDPFVFQQTKAENVSAQGGLVSIDVVSTEPNWTVGSDKVWCVPVHTSGSGNGAVVLDVGANLEPTARTATITLNAQGKRRNITLSQQPGDGTEHHYKLPVIVHVLYTDPDNINQNVTPGYMAEVVGLVSKRFASMNMELVMTATDPKGTPLAEPGVERIHYPGQLSIDPTYVMNSPNNEFKKYLWDPNRYINILLYPFDQKSDAAGVTHLPLLPTDHRLDGANDYTSPHLTLDAIDHTYCLSLNANYLYERSNEKIFNLTDFVFITAHEMGHYLGLHHTFTENQERGEQVDDCFDSDYCPDTPTYNRVAYERWLDKYYETVQTPLLADLLQRTPCNGAPFVSTNVMDYYASWGNQFTPDQRARVRHVLTYSLLMPGPKIGSELAFGRSTARVPFRSVQ